MKNRIERKGYLGSQILWFGPVTRWHWHCCLRAKSEVTDNGGSAQQRKTAYFMTQKQKRKRKRKRPGLWGHTHPQWPQHLPLDLSTSTLVTRSQAISSQVDEELDSTAVNPVSRHILSSAVIKSNVTDFFSLRFPKFLPHQIIIYCWPSATPDLSLTSLHCLLPHVLFITHS